jgi:hypothetical protein
MEQYFVLGIFTTPTNVQYARVIKSDTAEEAQVAMDEIRSDYNKFQGKDLTLTVIRGVELPVTLGYEREEP